MNAFAHLPSWLAALLEASAYGTALAALFLALQPLLRRALPARWRYALWLLVLVRFLPLPWPASPLHLPAARAARPAARAVLPDFSTPTPVPGLPSPEKSAPLPTIETAVGMAAPATLPVAPRPPARVAPPAPSPALTTPSHAFSIRDGLAALYALGAAAILARLLLSTFGLRTIIRSATPIVDPPLLALLNQARQSLGVPRAPALLAIDRLASPAVVGVWRPRLLLPRKLLALLSDDELHLIFLHELAHIRRRDVLVNYALALLNILHWFNPVLWFALAQVRADRELACDEVVLSHTSGASYGHTLLRLLELAQPARLLTPAVGVIETRCFLTRPAIESQG